MATTGLQYRYWLVSIAFEIGTPWTQPGQGELCTSGLETLWEML
ncbi:MAG: hypothetical protein AAF827_06970 [Cyanobacteria bacterium P01_D01_bin.6]